ncbi:tetratricopeptide repeat protein [Candidatus Kuenenia stuttgartensis]|uniref:tetratricopeptide repeat protein n=1 Tax=Kuenenia stuttgartiensis TaxID=174633 RepID=UPI00146D1BD3|nr:tetratricopeptide repeat protein [Candidatus Kuenenia stuttgartiensis]
MLALFIKKKQQYDEAVRYSQKAVSLAPENPIYTHNLAGEYVDLQQHDRAETLLREFNMAYPEHGYVNIYLLLADIYLKNFDWENAVHECQRVIQIDKKSIDAHRILGVVYYNREQYDLAKEALENTLTLAPDDKVARELLEKIEEKTRE